MEVKKQLEKIANTRHLMELDFVFCLCISELIEVTEKVLIREVLFIFQGIEGKIIKMDVNKDGFRLDPKVRRVTFLVL